MQSEIEVVKLPDDDGESHPLPRDSPLRPRQIQHADYVADLPRSAKLTRYRNQLTTPQSFAVAVGRRVCVHQGGFERFHEVLDRVMVTIAPGETVSIPSLFDQFIHTPIAADGTIQGGLAPRLTNLDRPELRVSEALLPPEDARPSPNATPRHIVAEDEPTLNRRGAR